MTQNRIALITKTRTQNQGNQALSIAWRDYLSSRYPAADIRLLERAPKYLKQYTASSLAGASDTLAAFDRIARAMLAKMPPETGIDPSVWEVRHDPAQSQVVRFLRLRQALRLSSRLAGLGVGEANYLKRLRFFTQADLVVVNPAGEFQRDARDTALHYLLETRCAQLAGCRTALVNLSFEVEDETIIRLSDYVFSACDIVEFRDNDSQEHFTRNGGSRSVAVLPDAAILSRISRSDKQGSAGLALAINALQVNANGLEEKWDQLLAELGQEFSVTLTSNEWTTDFPFWKRYLSNKNIKCDGQFLDYSAYARFLAGFDVVVSSRLHTCILGLVAGVAVVPVETGTFKLTGFFSRIGMAEEPVRMDENNWQMKLLNRINATLQERAERGRRQDAYLESAKQELLWGLDGLFSPALLTRNGVEFQEPDVDAGVKR